MKLRRTGSATLLLLAVAAGCSSGSAPNPARGNRVAPSPTNVAPYQPTTTSAPTTSAPTPSTTSAAGPGSTAAATAAALPAPGRPCTGGTPPARYSHVVWIVMENRGLSDIDGSGSAPYVNSLGRQCGLATDYSGVAHPSLPNYIALTSGSTQGVGDDSGPSSHRLAATSIFALVPGDWRSLEESMPSNCDHSGSGDYATKHDPAVYYTGLAAECTAHDVPLGPAPDVTARFTLITPNLCHDMHDCSTATGDRWLGTEVPQILDSAGYRSGSTALFITWDENDSGGSRVATYVIAPSVIPGTRSGTAFDHYSLLRTTEEMLGLSPLLGNAATATSMAPAFHLR